MSEIQSENPEVNNPQQENPEQNPAKQPSKAGLFFLQLFKAACYAILFLGMQIIFSFILFFVILVIRYIQNPQKWSALSSAEMDLETQKITGIISNPVIILSSICVLLFLWLFFLIRKKNLLQEADAVRFRPAYIPSLIVIAIGLSFFINTVLCLLPEDWLKSYSEASATLVSDLSLTTLLSTVLCAPLVEEFIFRGLILSRLKKAMPLWVAILISSFLFGLMHGQPLWICYASVLGILLCIVKERTGSIWASMLIHIFFNAYGVSISLLLKEYTQILFYSMLVIGALCIPLGYILLYKVKPKQTASPKNAAETD